MPTVSIVIPTWQRHNLLMQTIKHIHEQSFKNIEIIIVSDGPDAQLWNKLPSNNPFIRFVELGHNWSSMSGDLRNFGIAPLLTGYLMSNGQYIMPWCDDERALTEHHIQMMLDCITMPFLVTDYSRFGIPEEKEFPDFVFPLVRIWRKGDPNGPETDVIGTYPPRHGQITHYMFRPENFVKYGFPDWGSHPVDWSLIEKWMTNGAHGRLVNYMTFEHRLDR